MYSTHELECICSSSENCRTKASIFLHNFGPNEIELEEGYLEKLFLKESNEQGKHFDAPESVSKIVCFEVIFLTL
jgi:hypothetical protein